MSITTRLLASHLSGIRHYDKDIQKIRKRTAKKNSEAVTSSESRTEKERCDNTGRSKAEEQGKTKEAGCRKSKKAIALDPEEFYIKDKFDSVIDSLQLFKNDPLVFKPGMYGVMKCLVLYIKAVFCFFSVEQDYRVQLHKCTCVMRFLCTILDFLVPGNKMIGKVI